ncbi:MAG: ATP-binding protein [Syntrophaceticus sp.]|jgi:MinD superfamily P-loop ATPase|nr:ATP-binding protein [Syntrophaceticus sp.]MDD4360596.1 ATP-binding protein [Syntrophaceticus sp.]MDD4783817.1 ATP-binding protein [Syntrophaceticus sp.]
MIISILSGKGGTGKTTAAVNMAVSLAAKNEKVLLLDADVEEPNAGLYLKPVLDESMPVSLPVPEIDEERCDYCGECSEFCQFNALAVAQEIVLTFPELCHGCGGCTLVCPKEAIKEVSREIGVVEKGCAEAVGFWQGRLNIGEPFAVPVTRALKEGLADLKDSVVLIDAPAGVSCPVIEAVRGSDFALLVTEPTPFGRHDLGLALEMVEHLGIPHGVVINRAGDDDSIISELCQEKNVPIMLEIEFSLSLASLGAKGIPFSKVLPNWQEKFYETYLSIKEKCLCAN